MRSVQVRLFVGSVALFCVFALSVGGQQSSSYYDPQNILRFADSLYEEGDYLRAAIEYRRYLSSFSPSEDEAGRILFRVAICYRSGGREDTGLTYFQKLVREFHGSPFRSEALIQSALTWFTLGKYNESKDYLSHIEFEGDNSSLYRQKQSALLAANLLMQSKWREALAYLDDSHSPEAYPLNVSLKLISLKGTQLAYKSPLAAGFLSAIIPGLGKIYAQRTVDGLYSLLTIGLAGWQAYDGFHKDGLSSFKGWAFGVLGSILYIGNIYGSAVSVQIHNVRIRQKLYDEVRVLISAHF